MSHSMLWALEAQVRTCENHKVKNGVASLRHCLKHDHLAIMYGSDSAIVGDYIITKPKMARQVSSNAWNMIRDIIFRLCNCVGLVKNSAMQSICSASPFPLFLPQSLSAKPVISRHYLSAISHKQFLLCCASGEYSLVLYCSCICWWWIPLLICIGTTKDVRLPSANVITHANTSLL